jgi:hypothetical protein
MKLSVHCAFEEGFVGLRFEFDVLTILMEHPVESRVLLVILTDLKIMSHDPVKWYYIVNVQLE